MHKYIYFFLLIIATSCASNKYEQFQNIIDTNNRVLITKTIIDKHDVKCINIIVSCDRDIVLFLNNTPFYITPKSKPKDFYENGEHYIDVPLIYLIKNDEYLIKVKDIYSGKEKIIQGFIKKNIYLHIEVYGGDISYAQISEGDGAKFL